jgi:hypothetical protein
MRVSLLNRTGLVLACLVAFLAALAASPPGRAHAAPAATWGSATAVPGGAALNAGGNSWVSVISCTSAGTCSAGGHYRDAAGHFRAFLVGEVQGSWGTASPVPGLDTLDLGAVSDLISVSCASAGNCAAGGYYSDANNYSHAFVVNEVNGSWRAAQEVAGLATLDTGGSRVTSVSCASAGNCAAVGYYWGASDNQVAFQATEVRGTWRAAKQIPGTATISAENTVQPTSVSCASAGNCAAVGTYRDAANDDQAFVVNEVKGTWRAAKQAPGLAALHGAGSTSLSSVSCRSAGNCSAGGNYDTDTSGHTQSFVLTEVAGTWRAAKQVPGLAALNTDGSSTLRSISCVSAGNCVAGGTYWAGSAHVFLVEEKKGTWKPAQQIPGTAALDAGGISFGALSCSSTGLCSAGGAYVDAGNVTRPFVIDRVNGGWGTAQSAPDTSSLGATAAGVTALSCGPGGTCSAGGYYRDSSGGSQAFVAGRR